MKNIFKKFDMENCKIKATSCELFYKDELSNDIINKKKYLDIGGSLVYLMICTWPDLSYVVTKLSQHLSKSNSSDWVLLKHVFKYIKDTVNHCLTFWKSDLNLSEYCDADSASSLENRQSILGYCFVLSDNGPAISWKSKKQSSVALSTCKADYMALSVARQEVAYLTQFLKDVIQHEFVPVNITNNNQGAIVLVKNPVKHMKSKHIDIRYHFIHDYYQSNKIMIDYVESDENNVFTKPCKQPMFQKFKNYLLGVGPKIRWHEFKWWCLFMTH